MGLYGALVVRPAGNPTGPTTTRDPVRPGHASILILLDEIDPDLHHAVETGGAYDFTKLHNRYFTVNGREFPDTIQDNGVVLAAEPAVRRARPAAAVCNRDGDPQPARAARCIRDP